MSKITAFRRFFHRDYREFESFLRREAKYRRRARPGPLKDDSPDADRLRYEVLRARF